MINLMKISVALAAYKGEQYIAEQLKSILCQLGENDEIIVSDDFPDGETAKAVFELHDKRIKYIKGAGKGVVKNFENALNACTGDLIFLSDQDDVWQPDKVKKITAAFQNGADLVLHDAAVTDADLNITQPSYFAVRGSNASFLKNLFKNTFVGCCMAFSRKVMEKSLPFPTKLPMHDWWIALVAIKKGFNVVLLPEALIKWRRHGENVTGGKTTLLQKIIWRVRILLSAARIR